MSTEYHVKLADLKCDEVLLELQFMEEESIITVGTRLMENQQLT